MTPSPVGLFYTTKEIMEKYKICESMVYQIAKIGRFWSGCAQSVKHGLEIMGIGLVDIDAKGCMMLRAH